MTDPFNLDRFLSAQQNVYSTVKSELRRGVKRSHWMWFIFPQVKGLGFSPTATEFGISGIEEAQAYLQHPILGARLEECTNLVLHIQGSTLDQIFGFPDNLKFRSSMTLFAVAAEDGNVFNRVLDRFCDGHRDLRTTQILSLQ